MTERSQVDEKERLISVLRELDRFSDEAWLKSQAARKIEEAKFHDNSHDHQGSAENSKFYSVAGSSERYLMGWIAQNSPGKVVLDYACGNGECAVQAAQAHALLSIGLDISRGSIANARAAARKAGVEGNSYFLVGDCEKTGLPDNCVDVVICAGMLHHLDLSYALPELRRVMKPGAVAVVNEALNYNPAIKLYRRLTPQLRTAFEVEHIISHKELRFASAFFEIREVRYWHLLALLAVPFRRLSVFGPLKDFLAGMDRILLRIPVIRNLAWQFTFLMRKRLDDR